MKPVLIGVAVLLIVTGSAVYLLVSSMEKKEAVEGVLLYDREQGLCGLSTTGGQLPEGGERLPPSERMLARGATTVLDRASCEKHEALKGKRVRAEGRRVPLMEATGRDDLSNLNALAAFRVEPLP
jgi:hypothetical protein